MSEKEIKEKIEKLKRSKTEISDLVQRSEDILQTQQEIRKVKKMVA